MDLREAKKMVESLNDHQVWELKASDVRDAMIVMYGAICNMENRLSDRVYTSLEDMVPCETKGFEIDDLEKRMIKIWDQIDEKLTRLQGNVCKIEKDVAQCETDIEMLWRRVEDGRV